MATQCEAKDCTGRHQAQGYCNKHYQRLYKYGDPAFTKQAGKGEAYRYLVEAITSPTETCMLWPYMLDKKGYGRILYKGKKIRVHRLVMRLLHGDKDLDVLHGCGDTRCFNPDHLRYGTAKENIEDARLHGTLVVGSKSPSSKLTEADIPNIINDPRSHRAIGQAYGMNHRTIGRIKKHEAWKHVTSKEMLCDIQ